MSPKHGLALSAKLILIIGSIVGISGALGLTAGILQPTVFHGTTYAVERTPEIVALSIDSSISNLVVPTAKEAERNMHAVCKIQESAGTVFVTAGIVGLGNQHGDSSTVKKIIGDVLAQELPPSQIVPTLNRSLVPMLTSVVSSPLGILQWKDGSSALQIVMIGSQKGIPFMHGIEYVVHRKEGLLSLTPIEDACPGNCRGAYHNLTAHPPELLMTGNAVDDVRKWVQAELDGGNKDYLKPIQTIKVSRNGEIKWVDRPDFCPMILSY